LGCDRSLEYLESAVTRPKKFGARARASYIVF
jgi:hypothetical protein